MQANPLEIEEHSHAAMSEAYVAGASGLPFGVLRGYRGSDLPKFGTYDKGQDTNCVPKQRQFLAPRRCTLCKGRIGLR
jgi:acyl CoA:acetate/3-ketoacid CoA transferase alpha subunit